MAPISTKRRRGGEEQVRRPKKKIRVRKQKPYHSSSEDEDEVEAAIPQKPEPKSILKASAAVGDSKARKDGEDLGNEGPDETEAEKTEKNTALNVVVHEEDEDEDEVEEEDEANGQLLAEHDDDDDDSNDTDTESQTHSQTSSMTSSQSSQARKKRNDPTAFATSISKILDTKLSVSKRADPLLSRSKSAHEANKSIADGKLDAAARSQVRSERKAALNKGRITDLLGLDDPNVDSGKRLEEEKKLEKTAQRGVVKLFNAVRAAQVKAEEGRATNGKQSQEKVLELSKEGFLDMISRGQTKTSTA